ncbi:MAG: hypothetical protein R3C28_21480 [Pirellulaceae bacterium]
MKTTKNIAVCLTLLLSTATLSQEGEMDPLLDPGLFHAKILATLLPPMSEIVRDCDKAIANTSDDRIIAMHLCLKSEALSLQKQNNASFTASQSAMSLLPEHNRVRVAHARSLARLGEFHAAVELCNKALETDSRYVPALVLNATIKSQELGQIESALEDVNAAISQDALDSRAYMIRALVKNRLGRSQEALEDIDYHLSICPTGMLGNEAAAYVQKGLILQTLGRESEAIRAFETGLIVEPQSLVAAEQLWRAYNGRRQHFQALLTARRMREINRQHLYSIKASAISSFKTMRYVDSISYFQEWSSVDPLDGLPIAMEAACLVGKGQYAAAIAKYDESLALSPKIETRLAKAVVLATCEDAAVRNQQDALNEIRIILDQQPLEVRTAMLVSIVQYECGDQLGAIDTVEDQLATADVLSEKDAAVLNHLIDVYQNNKRIASRYELGNAANELILR